MVTGLPSANADGTDAGATVASSLQLGTVDISWEKEKWTGDDRPYLAARTQIDREIASSIFPKSLVVDKYGKIAVANPTNALDQFRWAYAVFDWLAIPHADENEHSIDVPVLIAMANANQPHCYQFARLRFLLEAPSESLDFARRLLDRNPDDVKVEAVYEYMLSVSKSTADQAAAIRIAQSIAAARENWPLCYAGLAGAYGQAGCQQRNMSYIKKAIAAGQTYVSLAPLNDWRRTLSIQIDNQEEEGVKSGRFTVYGH